MNSPFKFLRRVRIHGGECGAVARALHHEAKIQSLPAVGGNVSFTTNERKSMSIKTSLLKRIAQTAVVAILGGLLSTVAAPVANAAANSSISASCVARAGFGGVIKVNANGDNAQLIYAAQVSVTSATESSTSTFAPSSVVLSATLETLSTSTGLVLAADTVPTRLASIRYLVWLDNTANGANTTSPGASSGATAADPQTTVDCVLAKAPASYTLSATSASVAATESTTFTITPKDAAGNTTLLASNETITVTSSLTTAKITVGQEIVNATTSARTGVYRTGGNVPNQSLEAGNAVRLTANSVNTDGGVSNIIGGDTNTSTGSSTAAAIVRLGASKADGITTGTGAQSSLMTAKDTVTATGAFTVNVTNTAAASTTFTVAGTGTIGMSASTASTFTLTTLDYVYGTCFGVGSATAMGANDGAAVAGFGIIDGNQLAAGNSPDKSGGATSATCAAVGGTPDNATDAYTVSTAKKDVTITFQMSAAGTIPVTVAAVSTTSSTPSGITLATVNLSTNTDTQVSITLSATAPVAGQNYKVTWNKAANTPVTLTLTYADPQVSSGNGSVSLTPGSGKALASSAVTTTALVRDQFNSLVSGATVLWTVTGRNATTTAAASTTNASGSASYSFTDDATPATTLSDTVAATATTSGAGSYNAGTSVAYEWASALTVTTLRLTNNGASAGVDANGSVVFTATATGASGEALSGYPITFTGDAKSYYDSTSNSTVAYTGTNGVATATFKSKGVGATTITATSGGKTATSSFDGLAGSARTIALNATAASMAAGTSKRVTATIKDAYGNPIEDASITVQYSGTVGRVVSVNGISSSTGVANASGEVVIELGSDAATGAGTGTLTVKFTGGNTSTAAANGDGSAIPARTTSATAAITVTAADSSVVDAANAATDAAAEAIDAANAATDAANLAAEAADAATVAAEEARDAADAATAAVEELATQVATLMAALKAQITTLANTVAKIAKKVKA